MEKKRLIDADAVCKILESCEIRKATIGNPLTDWEYGYTCGIERAESEIECAPTVDAEPVRHGKYIGTEFDGYADGCPVYYEWKCSECGCVFEEEEPTYNYCPNCGAKMEGWKNE